MKKLLILIIGCFIPMMAFCQYARVRDTENTKVITVTELPSLVNGTLGRIGDGVFFYGSTLYNLQGEVIAKDLNVSRITSGNGQPVFSDGRATFDNGVKIGILDKSGKIIWSISKGYGYSISDYFVNGLAEKVTVKQNIPYREYINTKGETVFSNLTKRCSYGSKFTQDPFIDGLARYCDPDKNRWGFINEKGVIVIPAVFREVHQFSEGLAAVLVDESGRWGFIDTKGTLVIEDKFNREPEDFVGGCAIAEKNDGTSLGWGEKVLINPSGEVISSGWHGRVFRSGVYKFVRKTETESGFGYMLGEDGKELDYGKMPEIFDSFNYRDPVILSSGNVLTDNNLRSPLMEVLFISRALFPVNGQDDFWFELYDAGEGYIWIVDNYSYVHGIVNTSGEVVIHFRKSEF